MPDMLGVTALEIRHPVASGVLMKANDASLQGCRLTPSIHGGAQRRRLHAVVRRAVLRSTRFRAGDHAE
jgi:hypothetical protein